MTPRPIPRLRHELTAQQRPAGQRRPGCVRPLAHSPLLAQGAVLKYSGERPDAVSALQVLHFPSAEVENWDKSVQSSVKGAFRAVLESHLPTAKTPLRAQRGLRIPGLVLPPWCPVWRPGSVAVKSWGSAEVPLGTERRVSRALPATCFHFVSYTGLFQTVFDNMCC